MTIPTWWPLVDQADAGGAGGAHASSYGRGRHVDRWISRRLRVAILSFFLPCLSCAELPDLDGSPGDPRTPTGPSRPHATTPTECDAKGGEWIPDARTPAGGSCQVAGEAGSWRSPLAKPVEATDAGVDLVAGPDVGWSGGPPR